MLREISAGRTRTRTPVVQTFDDAQRIRSFVGRSYNVGQFRGSEVIYSDVTRTTGSKIETTYDNVTPGFKRKLKSGMILMNDYKNVKETLTCLPGSFKTMYIGEGWLVYDTFTETILTVIPLDKWPTWASSFNEQSLVNQSLVACHALIGAAPWQSIVSIAEFHKTVASLRNALHGLYRAVLRIRRTRQLVIDGLMSAAQAANVYLEIRYGLRPIYYDVLSVISAFEAYGKPKRLRYVAHVRDSNTGAKDVSAYYANNFQSSGTCFLNEKIHVVSGAIVEARIATDGFTDILGGDEIPQSLWELVPFSFIVDWFCNIGRLISAWTPKPDLVVKGTWTTVTVESRRRMVGKSYQDLYYGGSGSCAGLAGEVSEETTTRYANLDKPGLPSLTIRVDWLKQLDIIAILTSYAEDFRRWRI